MNSIVALKRLKDGRLGIGYKNKLPWFIPEDLKYFSNVTHNKYLIMGFNTFKSLDLKPLKNRKTHFVLTRKTLISHNDNVVFCNNYSIRGMINNINPKDIFVIGGSEIYNQFSDEISKFYVNIIRKGDYNFDSFYEFPQRPLKITSHKRYDDFDAIVYEDNENETVDTIYNDLLHNTLTNGSSRNDRTGTGTVGIFGPHISIDISDYKLPLLTTKFVGMRMVLEELLWFLKGDTDVKLLKEKNVNIWNSNTSREYLDSIGKYDYKEDELVEGYGKQIRDFNGFDQLKYIENLIDNDPFSRRIMWNLWNSSKLDGMVLPPCHNQVQFYVNNGKLSCHLYQRSVDVFLGFPWNIASYALFTFLLCKRHSLVPDKLYISCGDTHVYNDHIQQSYDQLNKTFRPSPKVIVDESVKDIDWNDIQSSHVKLIGYLPNKSIKANMS